MRTSILAPDCVLIGMGQTVCGNNLLSSGNRLNEDPLSATLRVTVMEKGGYRVLHQQFSAAACKWHVLLPRKALWPLLVSGLCLTARGGDV